MEYVDDRHLMAQWAEKKGPAGLEAYQREKNLTSIDGFPTGLRVPEEAQAPAGSGRSRAGSRGSATSFFQEAK